MDNFNVYHDIQVRTGGDIYVGVVGPVRTGKSTFIKRMMELLVLPNLAEYELDRTRDEMPQSAAGKTIMTTEPKFVPNEAALVKLGDDTEVYLKLIDCVGFMVEGASGHEENGSERMVKTPWFNYDIPFTKAAEIGTRKVINDHSTIGIVITSDASFGEIEREKYIKAEETAVDELKSIGKPFLIVLNTVKPYSEDTVLLAQSLEEKYNVAVMPINVEQLKSEDVTNILERILKEFPLAEMDFNIPKWLEILPSDHWLKSRIIAVAAKLLENIKQMKNIDPQVLQSDDDAVKNLKVVNVDMSKGKISIDLTPADGYYYQILSDYVGTQIDSEIDMMQLLKELVSQRNEYAKVIDAMSLVRGKGYGVVTPKRDEIVLNEPEIIKHGNKFGIKMKAEAPTVNLIKARIETEIAPIVGNEQQAKDLIDYINENSKNENGGIWDTNIFGKSIEQIVEDGIDAKVSQLTDDCQQKLQDAMQKIINDTNGGMICIII